MEVGHLGCWFFQVGVLGGWDLGLKSFRLEGLDLSSTQLF